LSLLTSGTESDPDSESDTDTRRLRLCHDLRQNLGAVHHLVEALAARPELPPGAREDLDTVVAELDVVSQLLRAELRPAAVNATVVDLAELVQGVARSYQRLHGVEVRVSVEGRVRVLGRPADLRRAVSNLLDNACRAIRAARGPSGVIEVRVRPRHAHVVVEIMDRGPGPGRIPAHTGHGLRQVRATAMAHGGRARLSARPGGGTRARLSLPRLDTFAS
jgi:two-component system sensor histidine kinase MprB